MRSRESGRSPIFALIGDWSFALITSVASRAVHIDYSPRRNQCSPISWTHAIADTHVVDHAGFILYLSDPQVSKTDADQLREALGSAQGLGNFRNLFLHSPSGKKDGLQLIPISDVAAKDEFVGIKRVTRDVMLAMLRVVTFAPFLMNGAKP